MDDPYKFGQVCSGEQKQIFIQRATKYYDELNKPSYINDAMRAKNKDAAIRYALEKYKEDLFDNIIETNPRLCGVCPQPKSKDKPFGDYFCCRTCTKTTFIEWHERICDRCSDTLNECIRCRAKLNIFIDEDEKCSP
jgi:hypothetical protein